MPRLIDDLRAAGPEEIIARYAQVARPTILFFYGPASCIAATRITIEVLSRFGVRAYPVPMKFWAQCHALETAYQSGFTAEELSGAKSMALARARTANGWNGHLVAVVDDEAGHHVIDASFDQITMPGLTPIEPFVLTFQAPISPSDMCAELQLVTDAGDTLDVRYQPLNDFSFLSAPAWEMDHLEIAIDMILATMIRKEAK